MSEIILGTAQLGLTYGINNKNGQITKKDFIEILKYAYNKGITCLDTAQAYGNAELVLSGILDQVKGDFKVHSKASPGVRSLVNSIKFSLERLKIKNLDVFYFHHFSDYETYKLTSDEFDEVMNFCNSLALSVYSLDQLKKAISDPMIGAIQLPFNLFDCSIEKRKLISFAKKNNKRVYLRSIFLQGLFFMEEDEIPKPLIDFSGPLKEIKNIATSEEMSIFELAISYAKKIVSSDGILFGIDTHEQLKGNIKALERNISDEAISKIESIEITNKSLLNPANWKL